MASAIASVMTLGGCGGDRDEAAMTSDLERDLALATEAVRPRTAVVSALEGGPTGAPSGEQRGRRDAVPTPRTTARPVPDAPVTETVATAETSETSAAPALPVNPTPEPSPEPSEQAPPDLSTEAVVSAVPSSAGNDDAGHDRGGSSRGHDGEGDSGRRGGGWGGVIGVVIRGGGAGIDHCEAHDRRNRGRNGTRIGGTGAIIGSVIGGVIGEAIERNRAPVGTPQRWPRY